MSRIWDKCAELGRQVSNAASETFRFSPGPNTSDLLQSSLFSIKIPCDIHDENLGYIGLAGYRLGHVCSTTPRKATFTPGLAAVLGLVHLNSDGYSAFTTAFSPYRILERHEYHRIITGLAIHPTTAGFLSSLADMYEAAAHLEACWGWKGMVASVLGSSILGSSIYVLGTKIASIHAPSSTLATEYYGFSSGLAIVSMALQVLSGYNMDVLQSGSGQQWVNRYQWGWRMLVSCSVASTSVLAPTRYAHIAGISSGLIITWIIGYIVQPSWGRRAGLSLKEILIQCGLLGISLFSYPFLDRHAQYTQESF